MTAIAYVDGGRIWMRPKEAIPVSLGTYGWVRLAAAEARDLAAQLLAAAEKLEPRKPTPAAPVVSWCEGMV